MKYASLMCGTYSSSGGKSKQRGRPSSSFWILSSHRRARSQARLSLYQVPFRTSWDRFEREARTASALNHPNIATIYHIGEHEGTRYIVMELVEGQTLRELLSEGPLSTKKTLALAKQIIAGLAKAHGADIVHRDLKPENFMVTEDGLIKILDFGLAKLIPQGSDIDPEMATVTKATRQGTLLGTVQYMSPEQAAGRAVDYRSDQFAFGSILYEMLTGRLAFGKETVPQTLAAIIEGEPEPKSPHDKGAESYCRHPQHSPARPSR